MEIRLRDLGIWNNKKHIIDEYDKLCNQVVREILSEEKVISNVMNHHYNKEPIINEHIADAIIEMIRSDYFREFQHTHYFDEICDLYMNNRFVDYFIKMAFITEDNFRYRSYEYYKEMLLQDHIECLRCFINICSPYMRTTKVKKIISNIKVKS